jgi:hypothetical protein
MRPLCRLLRAHPAYTAALALVVVGAAVALYATAAAVTAAGGIIAGVGFLVAGAADPMRSGGAQ